MTLIFSALVVLLTAVLCGISPALAVGRAEAHHESVVVPRRMNTASSLQHHSLIAVQFALAVMVLVGAALLGRSFLELVRLDPGFRADDILTVRISASSNDRETDSDFVRRLLPELASLPGVAAVAVMSTAPLERSGSRFALTDQPEPAAGDFPVSQNRTVSPQYFAVLGVPPLYGRSFDTGDIGTRNIVVNHAFVRRFFGGQDPTGKSITRGLFGQRWTAPIVGVVHDTRDLGLDVEPEPTVFFCGLSRSGTLLIRVSGNPQQIVGPVRHAINALDPGRALYDVRTMRDALLQPLGRRRLSLGLLAGAGALAVLLVGFGVFSVTSYAVTQRTREIAIRMTLGARRQAIVRMVLSESARPVGVGLIIGLLAAAGSMRLLRGLIFGVTPGDPWSFAIATACLLIVAFVAGGIVANRAASLDPSLALRAED